MPIDQSGNYSTANIGIHNEYGSRQSNYALNVDNSTINVHMGDPLNRATDEPDMKKLKEILKPITVSEQEANRSKCLDGTRVDLLQKIREWASSSDSPNIFLLTGIAGTGKSTIARLVAEEFKTKKNLGCYIFFERGKTDSSTITSTVIRKIAFNLAKNSSVIAESILEASIGDGWSDFPSTDVLFQILLDDPLPRAVKKGVSSPILIVLDALDECGSSPALHKRS